VNAWHLVRRERLAIFTTVSTPSLTGHCSNSIGINVSNLGKRIIDRLRRFSEKLASGEPIQATIVRSHITPDGPMHTFDATWLEMANRERVDGQCTCHRCENARMQHETVTEKIMCRPFIVCETCGNKRCPKATDCDLDCSCSNDPGQTGSIYG